MKLLRTWCAATFMLGGAMHFIKPRWYMRIMPPYVPAHREMVMASGVTELVGGAGLLFPRTRRPAGWLLLATLVAVFPANLHMYLNADQFKDLPGGKSALAARLPFQLAFMAWVAKAMKG